MYGEGDRVEGGPNRRAAFLPTSLTDVAFGLQRDDSIAVAPVMNPRAPTRTHS